MQLTIYMTLNQRISAHRTDSLGGGNVRDSLEETVLRCSLNLENIVNQEYHCLWDSSRAVVGVGSRWVCVWGWSSMRCDARCYFNVRSKADISQLNLPHGTDNWKSVKTEKKLKSKKTDMFRSNSKQSGKSGVIFHPHRPIGILGGLLINLK